MQTLEFARILFLAVDDRDDELAKVARETKSAIERMDEDGARRGVDSMARRMSELRAAR